MKSKQYGLFQATSEQSKRERYSTEISQNLKVLGVSDVSIQRIMDNVANMSDTDHLLGALTFFTQLTAQKSVRENYYDYSKYIAEFFCTISNIGLFAVAYYYSDYAVLLAATFSALSHAIPLQRLHDLDILGVFLIFAKVIVSYEVLMERPDVIAYGVAALATNLLDMLVTRQYLDKVGSSLHVAWHFAAALALYQLNQAQIEEADEQQCDPITNTSSSCTLF